MSRAIRDGGDHILLKLPGGEYGMDVASARSLLAGLARAVGAPTDVKLGPVDEDAIAQLVATGLFGADRETVIREQLQHRLRELVCEGWIKVEGINLITERAE